MKKTLTIIGIIIVLAILVGLVWSVAHLKDPTPIDEFTPAEIPEFIAPIQTHDGKG